MTGDRLLSRIPRESSLFIRYEDVCNAAEKQAQRVARFLSLDFEQGMIDMSKGVAHSIAGNDMKWKRNNVIELNEKWKTALSGQQLKIFESIAGDINHKFGYVD